MQSIQAAQATGLEPVAYLVAAAMPHDVARRLNVADDAWDADDADDAYDAYDADDADDAGDADDADDASRKGVVPPAALQETCGHLVTDDVAPGDANRSNSMVWSSDLGILRFLL